MFNKYKPYLVNSLILSLCLIIIGSIMGFAPFGKETLLTVDLGQQYIDFFSLFKETLSQDLSQLFYSFQKAIGGEMFGLWAYYLLSPFNFLLFFFNEGNYDLAVSLITFAKLLSMSLTMMYFIRHKYTLSLSYQLILSYSYTLMSYVIVFLLNIMWLDGLVMLPLICTGLDRLIRDRKGLLYSLSLAGMLIFNYYIGYMICIFLVFYAINNIIEVKPQASLKDWLKDYGYFITYSLAGGLMAGLVLLPTFSSLLTNKATHTSNQFNFDIIHTLLESTSKFFIASFDFHQLSSGPANLYAGVLVTLLTVFYFLNAKISWKEKVSSALILGFFLLSFRYQVLNLIWHGGQFPIWYDFRFSFLVSFFLIVLALRTLDKEENHSYLEAFCVFILLTGLSLIYYSHLSDFDYLSTSKIVLSLVFALAYLALLNLKSLSWTYRQVLILVLVLVELTTNASMILTEFNYVDQSKFRDYTQLLSQAVAKYQHGDDDFFRIHKNFMRTKNEAMYAHYSGLDNFSSTIDATLPDLYGYLGLPDGNGFVTYSNGTLFTDDFFNVRYLLSVTSDADAFTSDSQYNLYPEATDLDQAAYPVIESQNRYYVRENSDRFGLGIEVSKDLPRAQFLKNNPIKNQNTLLSLIDDKNPQDYFIQHDFSQVAYENLKIADRGDGDYFTYQNLASKNEDGYFEYSFTTDSANPYYFTLPSQYNKDKVSLKLDGESYQFYTPYRRRQITNASFDSPQEKHTFRVSLKEKSLKANLIGFYEFDYPRYQELVNRKQDHLFKVTSFSNNHIQGNIDMEGDNYLLFTIPFDKNWTVKVDNQKAQTIPALNSTLLAVPVSQGKHQIDLYYRPKTIFFGLGLTGIGILMVTGLVYIERKKPHLSQSKKTDSM